MNTETDDLYQEIILDHAKHPRNRGTIYGTAHRAEGHNPLCGDQVEVFVELDGQVIRKARFVGQGCAISTASADLMAERIEGLTVSEVGPLFDKVHELITGCVNSHEGPELEKLDALGGVCRFPMRVKCAALPWHALKTALRGEGAPDLQEDDKP